MRNDHIINPFKTDMEIQICGWELPKSQLLIPILQINGAIHTQTDIEIICFHLDCVEKHFFKETILLDLRHLKLSKEIRNLFLEKLKSLFKHVLCVGELRNEDANYLNLKQALITVMELMKKYRSDGGKNIDFTAQIISHEFYSVPPPPLDIDLKFEMIENDFLKVKITGKYPYGSEGNNEGNYINSALEYSFRIIQPKKLIVDMSQLDYEWGDALIYAPFPVLINREFPYRLIVSEQNKSAIQSLYPSETRISDSIEKAISEL